jgi:antitoxin component of MazEF toxin-antitoxin module
MLHTPFSRKTMHTSTLRAVGGSIAVTIPQSLAKSTGMHPGDKVNFEYDAGRLIISPINRRKYSLQDLLAMQGDEPFAIDQAWDNMPASGQEVAL